MPQPSECPQEKVPTVSGLFQVTSNWWFGLVVWGFAPPGFESKWDTIPTSKTTCSRSPSSALSHPFLVGRVPLLKQTTETSWYPYTNLSPLEDLGCFAQAYVWGNCSIERNRDFRRPCPWHPLAGCSLVVWFRFLNGATVQFLLPAQ